MFERLKAFFTGGNEKSYTLHFPTRDRTNWPYSWFQLDLNGDQHAKYGPVYACVAIIAQEIAKLPIQHYRLNGDGSRTLLTNSQVTRVLREPNAYQSRSDFMLYLVHNLLLQGNGYAIAERNNNRAIAALHPQPAKSIYPWIDPDNQDIYYNWSTHANDLMVDPRILIPQRDVLNIRLFSPSHPLIGETPISSVVFSTGLGLSIERNSAAFFHNQARPSGFLRVPGKLGPEARQRIKDGWQEAYSKDNQGKVGVLSDGAEWQQITMSAADAELVQQHKMTVEDIARVFRVPLFMLGDLENSSFNNVESTMRFFYQSTLSFYLEHIESALENLFTLPASERLQFDFESNLRTNYQDRIKGLADGVKGGIYSINEARQREQLPPIPGGENVFIQNQMQTVENRANNEPLQQPGNDTPATDEDTEKAAMAVRKAIGNAIYNRSAH